MTLEQARKICQSYQFLEGMGYDRDFPASTPVLAVMVAPFREAAQQSFVDDFDLLGYADLALYNPVDGYDVVVLARYSPDEEICLWMDLRSFVKRNMNRVAQYHKKYLTTAGQDGIAA